MHGEFHRMGETVTVDGVSEQCGRCWRPLEPGAESCASCHDTGPAADDPFGADAAADVWIH